MKEMSKLKEILEKLSYTRHTNSESADKQVVEAEKQILETHIPKDSLPTEQEIADLLNETILFIYQLVGDRDSIEPEKKATRLKDFRVKAKYIYVLARAIRERLDEKK